MLKRLACIVLACMTLAATAAVVQEFIYDIKVGSAEDPSLTFGMMEDISDYELEPFPPDFIETKNVWFVGNSDPSTDGAETQDRMSTQIQVRAESGKWLLSASGALTLTFSERTARDPKSVLTIAELDGGAATPITDGSTFSVDTGKTYVILYKDSDSTQEAPLAPAYDASTQMLLIAGNSVDVPLESAPEGYKIENPTELYVFTKESETPETTLGATVTVSYGVATVTLPDPLPAGKTIRAIQFAYRFVKDGAPSSDYGVVRIGVVDSLALTLISKELDGNAFTGSTVTVDPTADPSQVLTFTYNLAYRGSFGGKDVRFKFELPNFKETKDFPYTIKTITLDGKALVFDDTSAADAPEFTGTLGTSNEEYVIFEIVVGKEAGMGYIRLAVESGEGKTQADSLTVYTKGSGSMDFDGDGEFTFNDLLLVDGFLAAMEVRELTELPVDTAKLDKIKWNELSANFKEGEYTQEQYESSLAFLKQQITNGNLDVDSDGVFSFDDLLLVDGFLAALEVREQTVLPIDAAKMNKIKWEELSYNFKDGYYTEEQYKAALDKLKTLLPTK